MIDRQQLRNSRLFILFLSASVALAPLSIDMYMPAMPQMALAFVNTRPFVTATIVGATSVEQLKENIGSIDVTLSKEILKAIEEVHAAIPNPAP